MQGTDHILLSVVWLNIQNRLSAWLCVLRGLHLYHLFTAATTWLVSFVTSCCKTVLHGIKCMVEIIIIEFGFSIQNYLPKAGLFFLQSSLVRQNLIHTQLQSNSTHFQLACIICNCRICYSNVRGSKTFFTLGTGLLCCLNFEHNSCLESIKHNAGIIQL